MLKAEIQEVRTELKGDIHRLENKMQQMEVRLTNRMLTLSLGVVGVLGGLTTFLLIPWQLMIRPL